MCCRHLALLGAGCRHLSSGRLRCHHPARSRSPGLDYGRSWVDVRPWVKRRARPGHETAAKIRLVAAVLLLRVREDGIDVFPELFRAVRRDAAGSEPLMTAAALATDL